MKTMRLLRGIVLSLCMCILSVMSAEAQEANMAPFIESLICAFKSMKADTVRKDVIEPNLYRAFYKAEYHPVAKAWRQPMNGRKYCKSVKRPSAI